MFFARCHPAIRSGCFRRNGATPFVLALNQTSPTDCKSNRTGDLQQKNMETQTLTHRPYAFTRHPRRWVKGCRSGSHDARSGSFWMETSAQPLAQPLAPTAGFSKGLPRSPFESQYSVSGSHALFNQKGKRKTPGKAQPLNYRLRGYLRVHLGGKQESMPVHCIRHKAYTF